MPTAQPGDILLIQIKGANVRSKLAGWLIRLGAAIDGEPSTWNHVAIYTHDRDGVRWGVEGRPGGVGWIDLTDYLGRAATINNAGQPKTTQQRDGIINTANAMADARTPYDWGAIAVCALDYIAPLWSPRGGQWAKGRLPGHVICSAAADRAYEQVDLESPRQDRYCTPGDWARLIHERGWHRP